MLKEQLHNYIKWGFESRLKHNKHHLYFLNYYIKWGFESRLKRITLYIKDRPNIVTGKQIGRAHV